MVSAKEERTKTPARSTKTVMQVSTVSKLEISRICLLARIREPLTSLAPPQRSAKTTSIAGLQPPEIPPRSASLCTLSSQEPPSVGVGSQKNQKETSNQPSTTLSSTVGTAEVGWLTTTKQSRALSAAILTRSCKEIGSLNSRTSAILPTTSNPASSTTRKEPTTSSKLLASALLLATTTQGTATQSLVRITTKTTSPS